MSDDPLNYQAMTEEALRGVVRQALTIVAKRGLVGQHHFYLTFRTGFPGVQMAEHLRQRHPEEMTIVLQHQYWGLELTDTNFSVTLSFNGQHERLTIPFAGISAFVDPSVQFGLQFSVTPPANTAVALGKAAAPVALPASSATAERQDQPAAEDGGRVVALDAFRKDTRKK